MSALTDFIDKVIQRFPPSYRWDEAQKASWTEDMVTHLGGFSPAVLNRAVQNIVGTRKEPKTPLVSECIAACREAERWIIAEDSKGKLPIERKLDHTAERLKLANDIAGNPNDPLCVEAAKEGWVGILHAFVRKHGRMPDKSKRIEYRKDYRPAVNSPGAMVDEVEWCKREAKDFDEAYAKCVRGGWDQAAHFEKTGAEMLRKRKALADRVLRRVQ